MSGSKVVELAWGMVACIATVAVTLTVPIVDVSVIDPTTRLFPLVNGVHNAYHTWGIDTLISTILRTMPSKTTWHGADTVPWSLLVLSIGSGLLIRRIGTHLHHSPALVWIGALLAALSIPAVVGRDTVVAGTMAWIPILAISTAAGLEAGRRGLVAAAAPLWIVLLFVSMQNAASANQLSILSACAALCIAWILTWDESHQQPSPLVPQILLTICLFGPAVYSTWQTPPAAFPDYPSSAYLVPDDNVPGIVRPDVGVDYPLPVVDRSAVRKTYRPWGVILLVLSTFTIFLPRVRYGTGLGTRAFSLFTLALSASVVVDTSLREQISLIAPLQTLNRILPGIMCIPLTPIVCAFSAWMLVIVCLSTWGIRGSMGGVALAAVSFFLPFLLHTPSVWTANNASAKLLEATQIADVNPYVRKILISPSLYSIKQFDVTMMSLDRAPGIEKTELATLLLEPSVAPDPDLIEIQTLPSSTKKQMRKMLDGRRRSRWSPRTGEQNGDESIDVRFVEPTKVRRLDFTTGDFATDYPRGIQLEGRTTCDATRPADVIRSYPHWQGSLMLSAEGFPFFGPPQDARILFNDTIPVMCLSIKQTGHESGFDWSVAELGLVTKK